MTHYFIQNFNRVFLFTCMIIVTNIEHIRVYKKKKSYLVLLLKNYHFNIWVPCSAFLVFIMHTDMFKS